MIATVFDYGAGNMHSLAKALEHDDWTVNVEADPREALRGDVLILPGVGAFGAAAAAISPAAHEVRAALQSGHPCIGICLGMQLLFESSEEAPGTGLAYFDGSVTRLRAGRVPHIGWNTVQDTADPLFALAPLESVYYANGFVARPADVQHVIAWSTHEADRFAAAVRRERVLGVQFHPEKSSSAGIRFIHEALRAVTE